NYRTFMNGIEKVYR
ncbi:holo-(acyl carrier protein) synthase 2, partial [Haemophilus influenzae]